MREKSACVQHCTLLNIVQYYYIAHNQYSQTILQCIVYGTDLRSMAHVSYHTSVLSFRVCPAVLVFVFDRACSITHAHEGADHRDAAGAAEQPACR